MYRGLGTSVHVKPYLPLPPQLGSQPQLPWCPRTGPFCPSPLLFQPHSPPSPSGAWAWGGLPPIPQSISGESMTTAIPTLGWQHRGASSGQPGRSEFLLTLIQVPSAPGCRDCHIWCHLSTVGWDGRPVGKGDAGSLSCSPRTLAANGQRAHTHTHARTHTHAHKHARACTHTNTHTHTRAHARARAHTRARAHKHTHTNQAAGRAPGCL